MFRVYVLDAVSALVRVLERVEPISSLISSCIPVDAKYIASTRVVASVCCSACSGALTKCVLLHSLRSQPVVYYRT